MKTKNPIHIVGEGLTEKRYFEHLKNIKGYRYKIWPRNFGKTSIRSIIKRAEDILLGDVMVICVFDADILDKNKKEEQEYNKFKNKHRNNNNLIICDSLPAIEFWFLLHFTKTTRSFANNKQLCLELSRHLDSYEKTDKFLKNESWVLRLVEKMEIAVERAKSIDKNGSYSNVYKAIEQFGKSRNNQ